MNTKSVSIHSNSSNKYTLLLAILPMVMMYRTPFLGVGFATFLIAITLPFVLVRTFARIQQVNVSLLWPFFLYLAYALIKSDTSNALLCIAIGAHVCAISTGLVNAKYLRKTIETVSLIAAVCVTIQQIAHVLFGFHIPMIYPGGLIDGLKEYQVNIMTGIPLGSENMYRPCAFFIEPAQFSQYCIIGLGSTLFSNAPAIKKAILISIGLIMTTSGMGVVLTFGMWAWWILSRGKNNNKRHTFVLILLLILVVLALNQTSFFQSVVSRFMGPSDDSLNAITGRTMYWEVYFGDGQLSNFIFGRGLSDLPEEYFTGIMTQIYVYGIVGTAFLVLFLLNLLFKTKQLPMIFTAIYFALLFLANLTGFIPMIFNFGIIVALHKFAYDKSKYTQG